MTSGAGNQQRAFHGDMLVVYATDRGLVCNWTRDIALVKAPRGGK